MILRKIVEIMRVLRICNYFEYFRLIYEMEYYLRKWEYGIYTEPFVKAKNRQFIFRKSLKM